MLSHRGLKSGSSLYFPEFWVPVLPGGGDDGVRTHDPLLAGQVLSQLSYTPVSGFVPFQRPFLIFKN